MFDQMSFWDTPNVTSLPESADGLLPFGSQDGQTTSRCGREVAHVNLSARQAKERGLLTSATSGQPSNGLSSSAGLQKSLESRLLVRMGAPGSQEYALTWKHWDMKSGPQICALRASVRRISGSDCSGWVTPSARDHKDTPGMSTTGVNPDGSTRKRLDQLPRQAAIAGWPTVRVSDKNGGQVQTGKKGGLGLDQVTGMGQSGFPAVTVNKGGLNPALARWLMGYPEEWCHAAIKAWRLMPTKRQKPVG